MIGRKDLPRAYSATGIR